MQEVEHPTGTNGFQDGLATMLARPTAAIRLLLVDDHVILRQGICALLGKEDDFEVVGEAGSERAALMLTRELQPDIVLLASLGASNNGLDLAKRLLRSCRSTRVVFFTSSDDEKLLFDALRIGVHGYLTKRMPIDELLKALRTVQSGERVLGEAHVVTQVLTEYQRLATEQNHRHFGLSCQELEVLRLASHGCTNKEIGARLYWSEIQIKRKMQDIFRKLGATDRAQAVAEAMRQGLI